MYIAFQKKTSNNVKLNQRTVLISKTMNMVHRIMQTCNQKYAPYSPIYERSLAPTNAIICENASCSSK